jgi:hypothetical protein
MKKTDNCFRNRYAGLEIVRKTRFGELQMAYYRRRNVPILKPVDIRGKLPFNLFKKARDTEGTANQNEKIVDRCYSVQ